jgi:hypothetical protein
MTVYDVGDYCSGYSCCTREVGTLMYCRIAHQYVGKSTKACQKHQISWAGLAKKREEEKKKKEAKS